MRATPTVLAVGTCALVLGATVFVMTRDSAHATVKDARVSKELAPTIDQIRYRFSIHPSEDRSSDPLSAIPDLEARVATGPSAFDAAELSDLYLRRATRSGDSADYARAEEMAKRSLALLPEPNNASLTLARIATERHEFRAAIETARAHVARSSSTSAYTILAISHLALGELAAAAEVAETHVMERPSSSTYLVRALVYQAQGRDVEAAHDFARAADLEEAGDLDEAARLRALWARFLLRSGDTGGAELVVSEALRISPEHPLALAQRAELSLRVGAIREAREGFERAFAASREVRFLIDLARAQELTRDLGSATSTRAQVEKLIRAELTSSTGHALDLVEVLVDRGTRADLDEAIGVGTAEVARRPSAEVRFQLARAYHRAARPREGLTQLRAALASGARDARIYELAARLEAAMGNGPRAEMYRREAAKLDPQNSGWRSLGMAVTP